MPIIFGDFDVTDFWEESDYARKNYIDVPPSREEIEAAERELGYILPKSYIELAYIQNGGMPKKVCHRTQEETSCGDGYVEICGIFSIGREKEYSLCVGSKFMIEEWGYPPIGIYFADCPSAGHDMLCLDYRACGPSGEPQVVHVGQEWNYQITFVAETFEAFIRSLESTEVFGY
jgi:hypothetical protein